MNGTDKNSVKIFSKDNGEKWAGSKIKWKNMKSPNSGQIL